MPVFSNGPDGYLRTAKMRIGRYKNTPLWLFLVCLIIGAVAISSLILKSLQTDNNNTVQPADLATKIIDNLKKNQQSFRINFLLGSSDSQLLPNASIKGKMELNKQRQPFNLEFSLVDTVFASNKPTLKIMPQSQDYFLKPNFTQENNPIPEPLILLASLTYYQGLTKNIQKVYQPISAQANRSISPTSLKQVNQQIRDYLVKQTENQWLKIDPEFAKQLLSHDPQKTLDLCFLTEGVYFEHMFWDFENYSVNSLYQPTIELKFNQSKFINTLKSNPKHKCFHQLADDQIREATIDRLKDLKILVSVSPSNYLPLSILVSRPATNADNHQNIYQARFDFSFFTDGINSSQPSNYIHMSQLIRQIDHQVGSLLNHRSKH